ncbi:MAG: hypothetical protein R3B09_21145 [Nannocystaceae bacterium]
MPRPRIRRATVCRATVRRATIGATIGPALALASALACNGGGLGSSTSGGDIDERFIEAHLDFADGDGGDRDFAALSELGRDGATWGCKAIDQGSYYGVAITFSPELVTAPGDFAAAQGYDQLQVYFIHPTASDPARQRSTPVVDGTITFTTVELGGVSLVAGTFTGLRALSDDPEDPVDVTLVDGSFRCEGA